MSFGLTAKTRNAALLVAILSPCLCVTGQERAQDRRKFLDPATPVSDDPRRIPVKPGPRGPDRVLVLRGGRIFDGTGKAAREGTLVIERNKILKILPPASTDWPKNAEVVEVTAKTILPGLIDLHTHLTYPLTEGAFPQRVKLPRLRSAHAEHLLPSTDRLGACAGRSVQEESFWR